MKNTFFALLLSLWFVPSLTFADGTVRFSEDVLPLLKANPQLSEPLLRQFEIEEWGTAQRIGYRACPALAGKRLPPYVFRAKARAGDQAEYTLVVNSNVDFYGPEENLVYQIRDGLPDDNDEHLAEAVSLREAVSSIELLPASPPERARPRE